MYATLALLDFFRGQYAPLKLATAAASTTARYESDINRLTEHLGRTALLSDLTPETIIGVCAKMHTAGRSPSTCNKVRSEYLALATFAAKRGLASWLDGVQKQREFYRAPTAWDSGQLARLFAAADKEELPVGKIDGAKWWRAILAVIWDTGGRIGAVRKLKWSAVDLERGTVMLMAETQKQRADQIFRLHAETLLLVRGLRGANEKVFPWPRNPKTIWEHLRRILKRAGLPHGRRDMFHRMRRSVASHFEAVGGDATALLGHSSRSVTLAYLDPTIVGTKHPADVLFRP